MTRIQISYLLKTVVEEVRTFQYTQIFDFVNDWVDVIRVAGAQLPFVLLPLRVHWRFPNKSPDGSLLWIVFSQDSQPSVQAA